ncbi:hypothetical protein [Paraburkholderia bannensis]|uniref:hypothetical protein n=1 Tax=Paraburkholderia bannensis TaxID=765414 RepID=UPI002ABDB57B|nr:hypothetical protein [Paraburkholderia bannensis]
MNEYLKIGKSGFKIGVGVGLLLVAIPALVMARLQVSFPALYWGGNASSGRRSCGLLVCLSTRTIEHRLV